jgi:murein DD-endopeptidase MepM/ murein hydrolase activator NlpD
VAIAPTRRRKPPRPTATARPGAARHRRQSPSGPARRYGAARAAVVAAAAVAGAVVLAGGWAVTGHRWPLAPALAGSGLAEAVGGLTGWPVSQVSQPQFLSVAVASGGYRNPLRGVRGLVRERIDDGVDFSGTGPVYALGDAVVTGATATNYGWPGGGWITYQLTSGPAQGLVVYVAEDITPAVQTGQRVSPSTVIGTMFDGGDGIETGWAQASGLSAESELPQAGGIGGLGPFPTRIGVNFDELLHSLGVPAAPNRAQPAYGLLPAGYPASW